MLAGARRRALRERDELIEAIQTGQHDKLMQLLRKLVPGSNELAQDLRVLSNQVSGEHLSKDEIMEKMLEKLEHLREILAERAAAAIAGDSEIARNELSMTHEGYVKKTGQINGA